MNTTGDILGSSAIEREIVVHEYLHGQAKDFIRSMAENKQRRSLACYLSTYRELLNRAETLRRRGTQNSSTMHTLLESLFGVARLITEITSTAASDV